MNVPNLMAVAAAAAAGVVDDEDNGGHNCERGCRNRQRFFFNFDKKDLARSAEAKAKWRLFGMERKAETPSATPEDF